MALDTNRVLRIGVVYRGQVVAERVLGKRTDVTVGTRADCTMQISAKDYPEFPGQIQVAVLHNNQYHLVLPTDPSHGINLRGGPQGGMDAVKSQVASVKGVKAVPVEAFSGGSLSMGDIILMFQFVRGDTVPTVTHEETVLRIGLVHEDRLLSDQVFRPGTPVSVGASIRDTIKLPDPEYKGASASFTSSKGMSAFRVRLPKDSKLRLAQDGAPMDQAEAIAKKVVTQNGEFIEFDLPLKARGRATLGPYTILFQVVRQSITVPTTPRKSLASQLAGPLLNDSTWTVSLAISFVLLVSLVVQSRLYYERHERFMQNAKAEEQQENTTYEVQIEEKEEEKKEEEKKPEVDIMSEKAKAKQDEEVKKEEKRRPEKQEKAEEKPQSVGKQVDPEEARRQARAALEKNSVMGAFKDSMGASKMFQASDDGDGEVIAKAFGGNGEGGEGENKGPGSSGVKLAGGSGPGTVEKVKGTGSAGFKRDENVAKDEGPKKEEQEVKVVLRSGGMEGGDGESKTEVRKVVSRKNSAVQRCYEQALRDNPDVGGKVKVTFTVGTAGTITDVGVSGATGAFADCIKSKFTSIRGLPLLPSPQTFGQSYVFSKSE